MVNNKEKEKKKKSRTLNMLNFLSTETRKGSPVLGARDACRADSSLDVHKGSSCGGATLARGQRLFGGHGEWLQTKTRLELAIWLLSGG
jgi:hypothetical protein